MAEPVIVATAVMLVVMEYRAHILRIAKHINGEPQDEGECDSFLLLSLSVYLSGLHIFVDVRSARSWIAPLTAVVRWLHLSLFIDLRKCVADLQKCVVHPQECTTDLQKYIVDRGNV